MIIKGIYLFKADSGITLYSKKDSDISEIHEDLLTAFMSAIREFFTSLELGGLSAFSTENYNIYYVCVNNIATVLIVNQQDKSDKFYRLSYEICSQFFSRYKKYLISDISLNIPDVEHTKNGNFSNFAYNKISYL